MRFYDYSNYISRSHLNLRGLTSRASITSGRGETSQVKVRPRMLKRPHTLKIISLLLSLALVFSPYCALAERSNAGGGDTAEFDFGDVAISMGINLGAMAVGSALGAGLSDAGGGISGALGAMGSSLASTFSTGLMTNIGTISAVSQVGRAVGAMGQYYDWEPSNTFLASSIASGASGGLINPSVGPLTGALVSAASAGTIVAIDGDRMDNRRLSPEERRPGVGAQIAGFAAGVAAGQFANALTNPATYENTVTYKETRSTSPPITDFDLEPSVPIPKYYQLVEISGKQIPGQVPLTDSEIQGLHSSPDAHVSGTRITSIGDTIKVITPATPSQIASRLTTEPFIKTLDLWPQLGASALAMWAGDQVAGKRDNNRKSNSILSPSVVTSLIQGVATPLFGGIAKTWGLQPSLYVGENSQINYNIYKDTMGEEIAQQFEEKYKASEEWKKDPIEKSHILAGKKDEIRRAETLGEKLDKADMWRIGVFFRNAPLKETLYGLMEGSIHAGISYGISQLSNSDDPRAHKRQEGALRAAAVSYGADLVTAAIRGVAQKVMYDYTSKGIDEQITALEAKGRKDANKEQGSEEIKIQEMFRPEDIKEISAKQGKEDLTEQDLLKLQQLREINRDIHRPEYGPVMDKGYTFAILTSMQKANNEFLQRSLAFGAPRPGQEVTVFTVVDYLDKLSGYARIAAQGPGWFASALSSSASSAGSAATSNNVITTLGATLGPTPLGKYLNIHPYSYQATSAARRRTYRER